MTENQHQKSAPISVRIGIDNSSDQSSSEILFTQFPIRIGRNKLNDLVLAHPYVSNWHAVIGYQDEQLTIAQVGKSNPVMINGEPLSQNQRVFIHPEALIEILPFRIRPLLMELPKRKSRQSDLMDAAIAAGNSTSEIERIALAAFNRLAHRYIGNTLKSPKDIAHFATQLERVLDIFLRCFIALDQGQKQFRSALDHNIFSEKESPLDRIRHPLKLAQLLFNDESNQAIESLEQAFKNIVIHQVALLSALMEGVQSLLKHLSPEEIVKHIGKTRPTWRQLWEQYVETHADLAEEDNESFDLIFGKQFSRAYATLVEGKDIS